MSKRRIKLTNQTLKYMGVKDDSAQATYQGIAKSALDLINQMDDFSTTRGLGRGSAIVEGAESLKQSDSDLYQLYDRVQENYSNFKGSLIALQEYADQATRDAVVRD